jgi:hypothetical protein
LRIIVLQYGKVVLSLDPTDFATEDEVVKAFGIQRVPDEEYTVRIENGTRVKQCHFDGDDALVIIAVLCYRGLQDEVFSFNIPNLIEDERPT